jgi:hypothetical protein
MVPLPHLRAPILLGATVAVVRSTAQNWRHRSGLRFHCAGAQVAPAWYRNVYGSPPPFCPLTCLSAAVCYVLGAGGCALAYFLSSCTAPGLA